MFLSKYRIFGKKKPQKRVKFRYPTVNITLLSIYPAQHLSHTYEERIVHEDDARHLYKLVDKHARETAAEENALNQALHVCTRVNGGNERNLTTF